MTKKKGQAYPIGWNEQRIRKLAKHYDNQTEDEQVAEHEAGREPAVLTQPGDVRREDVTVNHFHGRILGYFSPESKSAGL